MSVQQFCLRWNNHQPNFISVCSSLLHNGTLVDVTLAAEGRQLQAHKIVLSACSSYFQTLFTTNPCQHPIVILKDVQYDDLKTMVDFMYYGEVNVSQEQLPHILKTAEMLKIKGLAEMPTDPANLTKSESKSSNEPTELVGSAANSQGGGGSSGGLGSSTGGSVNDSLWGSTESQFQHQQHHHQQLQQQQQQQQQQQLQQQHQQQHHHHQQQHHQQQQNSQTQTTQQHHQLRRTPSPLGAGSSPATRRKRLRKSSNNGSSDRNNSEDPHNTSLDASNATAGITLSQMSQMSFNTGGNGGPLGGIGTHAIHTTKLLKDTGNNDLEPHPHDSDSLDDGHGHVHMQIKPEVDISGVQQSIPLDISGATTPSEHDAPNSQSSHSDQQHSSIPTNYSTTDNIARNLTTTTVSASASIQQQMGSKRNRILTRQPRVKRDSDSLSNSQISPEPATATSALDFEHFSNIATSTGNSSHSVYQSAHQHAHLQHHHHLLTVPTRIERHSSEPAPSLTSTSPHLLTVPQSTPYLIKQHSDPLLPSQHSTITCGNFCSSGSNPLAPLHRQYSHPLPGSSSSSNSSHITTTPLHHSHHISLPESIYASGSPPPAGSSHYVVPQRETITSSTSTSNNETPTTTVTVGSSAISPTKALSLPQFSSTHISDSGRSNPTTSVSILERSISETDSPPTTKYKSSKSTSCVSFIERNNLQPGTSTLQSSSFDHLPIIRTKNEELQRSVSSPQTSREIITLENPRSSHCPVIRPGPALGCNFCWNTIDGHGRILRRKTKYHCPECQTNLCIVPCFQEYHERLNNDAASTSNASSNDNSKNFSSTSGGGSNVTRHYTKTESI